MSGAARVNDPIEHSQAYFGFIAGAIVGAIAGVAVTVFTEGAGAGVGLGVYAATASFGEWLGSFPCFNHVTGTIQTGSPNVFINGLPAAVATDSGKQLPSQVICSSHVGPQFIAEGSTTVFINGRPASRIGDHTTCGAKISGGSNNVFIGGGTVSTVDIESEVPVWGHVSVVVSGLAAGLLLRLPVKNMVGGAVAGAAAGYAGYWLGGKIAGEGSNTQHFLEGTFGAIGAIYAGTPANQRARSLQELGNLLAGRSSRPAEPIRPQIQPSSRTKLAGPTKNWQTYLAKESEAIKKAPLRGKVRNFQAKINSIRAKMPNNNLKKYGNMAIADVRIDGLPHEFKAHSKIHYENTRGSDVDKFSYSKSESERVFKNYEPASSIDGRAYDRYNDTEAKILEHIASLIDKDTNGTISLYTELDTCQSCTNIIFEFREEFPNITLNIFSRSMGE